MKFDQSRNGKVCTVYFPGHGQGYYAIIFALHSSQCEASMGANKKIVARDLAN